MYLTPPLKKASISSYICLFATLLLEPLLLQADFLHFSVKQDIFSKPTHYDSMIAR